MKVLLLCLLLIISGDNCLSAIDKYEVGEITELNMQGDPKKGQTCKPQKEKEPPKPIVCAPQKSRKGNMGNSGAMRNLYAYHNNH